MNGFVLKPFDAMGETKNLSSIDDGQLGKNHSYDKLAKNATVNSGGLLGNKFGKFLGRFDTHTPVRKKKETILNQETDTVKLKQAILDDFVNEYKKNKTSPSIINDLMSNQIVDIADIMENYYDNKYADIMSSMNDVITLVTTKVFAISLNSMVSKKENFFRNWEDDKIKIASLLSLALETSHTKMMTETKSIYIDIIKDIYDFEIKDVVARFNITEDAALDLFIGVPRFGKDMNDKIIQSCYDAFLNMLINHGGCAINYLNAEHQKELFYYLFKDENSIALKAAGQCLGDSLLQFEEEKDQVLYNEYIKMLYDVLNEHDFDEIRKVLRYIVKVRSNTPEVDGEKTVTVFSAEKALEYENIKNCMLDYIDHSENAKKYLV